MDVNCILNGLLDGNYVVEFYETRGTGGVFESNHVQSENGELVIVLPVFTKDIAFKITSGTRTFEWSYSKDGSESGGDDTAWIDDIVFPAD